MTDLTTAPTITTLDQETADHHDLVVGTERGVLREHAGPTGPITAVAAASDGGIWAIEDGVSLWHIDTFGALKMADVPDGTARVLAVDGDDVWVGGSDAGLWRWLDGDLRRVESFDRAPTHDRWYTPWGGPPDVFAVAARDGAVFVNVHVGGILRSLDGGASWHPTIDLAADVHDVAIDPHGDVWAATGGRGLVHSSDRGETWTSYTDGLHSSYAIAVTPTADGALVFAASGPRSRDGLLYRLDGDRLVVSSDGLPESFGGTIWSARLASNGDRAAIATPDGIVFASDDGGRSWTSATDGVDATAVSVMT